MFQTSLCVMHRASSTSARLSTAAGQIPSFRESSQIPSFRESNPCVTRWLFWGFFCAYLAVGAYLNMLVIMLCYHAHRFSGPSRSILLIQVRLMIFIPFPGPPSRFPLPPARPRDLLIQVGGSFCGCYYATVLAD